MHESRGEYREAVACFEQALPVFRAYHSGMAALCLGNMGAAAGQCKDYTRAMVVSQESIVLARAAGNLVVITVTLKYIGMSYFGQERYTEAKQYFQEALDISRVRSSPIGIAGTANCLNFLGHPTALLAQYSEAESYFRKAL